MERHIVYIHGAFSSGLSFARIQESLPEHKALLPQYTVEQPLEQVVNQIHNMIVEQGRMVDLISHSLGGLVAVALSQRCDLVRKVVTIGSPFGGSRVADTLKWFVPHELFRTLNSNSTIIRNIANTPLSCPVRSIITTVGNNPMMFEPNDGVVSLKSQQALVGGEKIFVPLNHFEVLLSDTTVELIKEFIFERT